ncbi:MAG TPA: hypothetical protein VKY85_25800 [Candidatus Angelobacter sp.]|jgi:hypothetical protein|nr:hypothetical protein [Candidatus Angelobacter sp.]
MNYFTALMTERVIEDGFWLVVLAAVLAFFWFHRQGKRQGRQSELEVMKPQQRSESTHVQKKAG